MEKKRTLVIEITIIIFFGLIFFRLAYLHLTPPEWITSRTEGMRLLIQKSNPSRGQIVDRNGELFALDAPGYTMYADPKYIKKYGNVELVSSIISRELFYDKNILMNNLLNSKRAYYPLLIKKPETHSSFKNFSPRDNLSITYKDKNGKNIVLNGVVLKKERIRSYPKGLVLSHVLGYINFDRIGSGGIEQSYHSYLLGKEGLRKGKKDARKKEIYDAREIDRPAEDGAKITLTIDQEIQNITEDVIYEMFLKFKTKSAWAIVQDVQTGEILAMASYPTFNPVEYNKVDEEWRRNRAISINFDPGSTLKTASIGIAIDKGVINVEDQFDCENGRWLYAGKYLNDWKNFKTLNVQEILKNSSNIGTAKIMLKLGDKDLYDGLKNFGFGEKLSINLPGEEKGQLNDVKKWTKISSSRIGIGQGITATGLQMITLYSTVANDGVMMKPYIVKKIESFEGDLIHEYKPEVIRKPISLATSQKLREMLTTVVDNNGTGNKAKIKGYKIAGKTGTAQKVKSSSEGGGYYDDKEVVSFIGFFPANNPQISILVMADEPSIRVNGKLPGGGTVCAPAFKEIAEHTIKYLKISPEGKRIYITQAEN